MKVGSKRDNENSEESKQWERVHTCRRDNEGCQRRCDLSGEENKEAWKEAKKHRRQRSVERLEEQAKNKTKDGRDEA